MNLYGIWGNTMHKQRFILMIFYSFFYLSNAYAISGNFSEYANFANNSEQSSTQKISQFDPTQFKNYTPNPDQTKYYQGGTSDSAIKNDTPNALNASSGGQAIETTFGRNQQFSVNPSSPEIQRSKIMEKDSYNITHGISDQYVQCQKQDQSNCNTDYYQSQCLASTPTKLICYLTPNVTVNETPYQMTVPYNGSIPSSTSQNTFLLPEDGVIKHFSIVMHSSNIWRCHGTYQAYVNGVYISTYYPSCDNKLGDLSFSNSNLSIAIKAGVPITFRISGNTHGTWGWANYSVSLLVNRIKKTPVITIENSCQSIPAICSTTTSNCLEAGSSKIFDGVSVYQPCWRTEQDYSCGPVQDQSCNTLLNQGCSMINNTCTETFNNVCIQYQDTMSCPKKDCVNTDVVCGTHSFCMDGNCYQPRSTQNQNFGKDEAQIAAVTGAAASVSNDQQNLKAFSGSGMSCSLAPIGFLNCCANHGWGKDIGLANCTADEKKLGVLREKGYAIYVGKYCSHHFPGTDICIEHSKAFCVFNGFLAKDVQDQGRHGQLNIGFGDAKNPDCSGLTVDQLKKINFGKIDFSNLEQSLENQSNFPSNESVQQYIANKVKQEMGNK